MKRFILLYDCPIKTCDKIWLYNGLKKYGKVKLVKTGINVSYFRISRILPKIKLGIIIERILIYLQILKALIISNQDDIVITWSNNQGVIFNKVCQKLHINRKIVSFNWISLPKKKNYKKVESCLKNKNFIPIINNKRLEEEFINLFNLEKWNGIFLPDVFDDKEEWLKCEFREKQRYVFSGGVNNRDWQTLMSVAKETPKIKYIIVSGKDDIKNKLILDNVKYFEELEMKEYYKMMKKSFLTVCPLKEDKVSGLINIIKSIQYGIPCISTKLDVTDMYYPLEMKELLYERNNKEDLKKCILKCYSYSKKEYINKTKQLQDYLQKNFNPQRNVDALIMKIQKSWEEE